MKKYLTQFNKKTEKITESTVKLGYNEQLGTGQICSL
jgi:hypothetical protein